MNLLPGQLFFNDVSLFYLISENKIKIKFRRFFNLRIFSLVPIQFFEISEESFCSAGFGFQLSILYGKFYRLVFHSVHPDSYVGIQNLFHGISHILKGVKDFNGFSSHFLYLLNQTSLHLRLPTATLASCAPTLIRFRPH